MFNIFDRIRYTLFYRVFIEYYIIKNTSKL